VVTFDICITLLLLLVTLLPLSHHPAWWVRVWDFPRLQLLIISALLGILQLLLFTRAPWLAGAVLLICLACCGYQCWWIFPYTRLLKKQVRDAEGYTAHPGIRILVSNVLTPNRQAGKLLKQIRIESPDVLVAVETDTWWEQQLSVLDQDYPYSVRCPKDNLYGMHVWSRLPLRDAEIQYLVDPEIPSMHMLVTLPEGIEVRLHCVHPMPPSPTENDESRDRDAELVMVGKSVAQATLPVIVTGDLNDVAWSRTTRLFLKISGLLDPRRGRGMYCTFNARYPLLRWPLDHIFHSQAFILGSLRRLEDIGSDHYPFLAHLLYVPQQGQQQESLVKEAEDEQLAVDILQQNTSLTLPVHTPGENNSKFH